MTRFYADAEDGSAPLSTQEMSSTLEETLLSSKSDEALQNELFDLLGFDKFEFIQTLLQHRSEIVASANKAKEKKKKRGDMNNGIDKLHHHQQQQMALKLQHQQLQMTNSIMLQQQQNLPTQPPQQTGYFRV